MSIVNLRRQNARGSYPSDLDRQQLRQQEYGFIDLAARSTSTLITQANQEMIWYSWGAPVVQIPVFSKNVVAATVGSMTCAIPAEDAVAALVNVTFVKAFTSFRVIPRLTDQSGIVNEAQDFMRQYTDAELSLATYLETQIYNTIDGAIATTYNSAFVGAAARYPLLVNALQVAVAEQPFFFNDAKSIMMADDFSRTGLTVIGDAQLPSFVNQYVNQGAGNNQDTAFQFNGYTFGYSRTTTTSALAVSTGYIMPEGSLAVISRVSGDAQQNRSSESGVRWTVENSELLGGLDIEMMIKDECADMSAITENDDDKNTLVRSYQLGLNAAIITPYNTGTNGGIKKFDYLS